MEEIYTRLSTWDDATRELLWRRWLWECDCTAAPVEQCYDMNEMHALGILVCLGEYQTPVALVHEPLSADTVGGAAVLHLQSETPIEDYTLRELLDQIECLQLHWGPAVGDWGAPKSKVVLRALMARLGAIAHHAYPIGPEHVLDDPQHITPLAGSLGVISRKSLRQALCVLLVLCRVCEIVVRAHTLPESDTHEIVAVMRKHHIEASMDCFNVLQQMMYLAPGQRLSYRTMFAGMYNDVSQVVFFHHPRFARKPQIELSEVPQSPMHMLPLMTQLLPEIGLVYDDDAHIPGLVHLTPPSLSDPAAAKKEDGWYWLVCCGAIFLMRVDAGAVSIWRSNQMAVLVKHYLEATHKSLAAVSEEEEAPSAGAGPRRLPALRAGAVITPCNHVQLLSS
jgi:hypothetical protein